MTRSLSDFLSEIKRRHLFVLIEMVDRSVEIFDGFFFFLLSFFLSTMKHIEESVQGIELITLFMILEKI